MITFKVKNKEKEVKFEYTNSSINICLDGELSSGDILCASSDWSNFLKIQFDETLKESIVYLPNKVFEFTVPDECEIIKCYGQEAFKSDTHKIKISEPNEEEVYSYRLLSLNPHAQHDVNKYFPYAEANFVTRNDPCFYARNAIDGVCHNDNHGNYPYHSWAGGAREDLEYYIHFGREI